MRSPFQTPFAVVFWNEVLVNTKRVAPYALMILFSANAILWWGWGPAVERGWATNSDFYIFRNLGAFSFLLGLPIFTAIMMGDPVVRDFRLGVDPIVWSTPAPNSVFLLSKSFATALLALALLLVVGLIAIVIQVLRGHTPVDFSAYLIIYSVVVVPGIVFMTSLVLALNVILRNKYATYVVAVGAAAGLLYLYNIGYNHWSYNPLLYRLWTYADLTGQTMLTRRLYCLALAAAFLALAHLVFERKST